MKKFILFTTFLTLILYSSLKAQVNLQWAKQLKGTNNEIGTSIAVDASGNVYTIGYFDGTTDFDPDSTISNLTTAGYDDIFVSKLDASGNYVWAKKFGSTGFDDGQSIAVDASGVYITGTFTGTVNFGTGNLTSAGNNDIFVVKLTTTGTTSWAKRIGGTLIDNATSLKLDGSANVIITGTFAGTVDFDPGAGTANLVSVGSQDIFILKLDASGNYVWAKNIGSMTSDGGWAVAVDGTNNVFVTGSFSGIADFDPSTTNNISLTPVGGKDIFVLKLDASANYVWAKSFGGSNDEEGYSIAVDGSGNVVTTGFFYGTVDFDPGAGTSNLTSNGYDIFVSKLNSTGAFVWAKNMGGSSADYGYSIAVDALDNVYTTGYFNLTADFDPGSGTSNLISKGNSDVFLSKLNSSGSFVFVSQFGGTSGDRGLSLTANSTNNIFMTGFFSNTVDFDPSVMSTNICRLEYYSYLCQNLKWTDMIKYRVTLTKEERDYLLNIAQKGKSKAQRIRNAIILLNCDEGGFSDKKSNSAIAQMLFINERTIERVKKLFVEESFEMALNGKTYEISKAPKIDGEVEAKLVTLACSETPEGYARWTLRLLAEKMIELRYLDSISHETVRQVLKKTNLSLGK